MPKSVKATRQLAGILVTDLVGSTALRVRLGDGVAEGLRRQHERLVRRCAARHGAQIVHWLGDGVLAAFPSASAAMQAGIAVQRGNDVVNRRPGRLAKLAIRVGVAAGETEGGSGGVTGRPVDEATALCNEAEAGEILCLPDTLALIGSRIELQAQPRSSGRVQVDSPPPLSVAESLGLPHALEGDPRQLPFVGRSHAMLELRGALDAMFANHPQIVSIIGDAGIGKTRLAAELAREALERGAAILFGTCHADLGMSNAPVAQALRGWVEVADELSARLGPGAGELTRLVPGLGEREPGLDDPTESDAETERLRLYDAVAEWLVEASLDEPTVLILDSMQWGGPSTFRLIRHVLPLLDGSRVMIVTTSRSGDGRAADLVRDARVALGPSAGLEIDLAGLDVSELGEFMDHVHHARAQRNDAQLLHAVTGGNPLHVNEIMRWSGIDGGLPRTIHAAVGLHLDLLDSGQRRIVESAAVLGTDFEARCLAEMMLDLDATLDGLDAAVEAGLLLVVDPTTLVYRFAHDETRRTVLEGIGAGRMTRLHERAGLAIEEIGAAESMLANLALHFTAALPLGYRKKAVDYAARAAQQASLQYDNESAAELYQQALDLLGSEAVSEQWCDLAIGLGESLRRIGDPRHRSLLLRVADRAHELGDAERMARALFTTYRGTFSRAMRVEHDYVDRLRRAVDYVGEAPSTTRARLLALLGVENAWAKDQEENRHVMDAAVVVARKLSDQDLLTTVLAYRQWVVFHPLSDRLADTEELAALARNCADPLLRFDALGSEVFTRTRAGDRSGLDRAMGALRRSAEEVDQPLVRWMLMIRESALALMDGEFDVAEKCIAEGHDLALATGQPDAEPQYIVQRFWLDVETQPAENAVSSARLLAANYEKMPSMTAWSSIAFRCADIGLVEEAKPILRAMTDRGFGGIPMDQRWLVTLCGLAVAAAATKDTDAASQLHTLLEPHASEHANVVFTTMGSVERYLGLLCGALERGEEAVRHFERAITANREIGAVTWLTRCQIDYLECRSDRGYVDRGWHEILTEATFRAERIGLPTVLERAREISSRHRDSR